MLKSFATLKSASVLRYFCWFLLEVSIRSGSQVVPLSAEQRSSIIGLFGSIFTVISQQLDLTFPWHGVAFDQNPNMMWLEWKRLFWSWKWLLQMCIVKEYGYTSYQTFSQTKTILLLHLHLLRLLQLCSFCHFFMLNTAEYIKQNHISHLFLV